MNYISEKYRKYLLEVIFEKQRYYTVFGADLSDNELDKLLIDKDKKLILYSSYEDLLTIIRTTTYFFDTKTLQEWAKDIEGIKSPYATISLDVLSISIDFEDVNLVKSVYDTLGIIEDYANQVNDEGLFQFLQMDTLVQFKNEVSDYFIWSESKELKISVDINALLILLKEINKILKGKLITYKKII